MPLRKFFTASVMTVAAMSIAGTLTATPAGADPVPGPNGNGWDLPAGASASSGDTPESAPSEVPAEVAALAASGRFWLWENQAYTSYEKSYSGSDRSFANDEWDGTSISVDDDAESACNYSNRTVGLYTKAGYAGASSAFPTNYCVPDLNVGIGHGRDTPSSVLFV
ncbi:hypothetical protein [Nonomuraea sp. NPDC049695]|uniref:hypothetical protein n=1 Tax=Nonomuraea sp. NPDC049695 TaxID=3154734 RepID=UPI00341F9605